MSTVMLFCRAGGRLSAAAQAFMSPGSLLVQVTANAPRDSALLLRKGNTFQRHRGSCASVGAVTSTLVPLGKQPQGRHSAQNCDSSSGVGITDWKHLDRVAAIAENLSRSARTEGANLNIIRLPLLCSKSRYSNGEAVGRVFTGHWKVSSPTGTGTMWTRASSTAAAAKKSEGRATDSDKGVNENH